MYIIYANMSLFPFSTGHRFVGMYCKNLRDLTYIYIYTYEYIHIHIHTSKYIHTHTYMFM